MNEKAIIGGKFYVEHIRDGKVIWRDTFHNVWTNEGMNHALNVVFHGESPITTWYVALFESNSTPALTWTYATPVCTECTAYVAATRPEYVEAASTAKKISNTANKASFTFNASKTIYGGFLVGGGTTPATKGDTAGGGKMSNAGRFTTARAVESGDVLNVTYEVELKDQSEV